MERVLASSSSAIRVGTPQTTMGALALTALALVAAWLFAVSMSERPLATAVTAAPSPSAPAAPATAAEKRALASHAQLPATFSANAGQARADVRYLAQGAGYSIGFAPDHAVLALRAGNPFAGVSAPGADGVALHMRFRGANPDPRIVGLDRAPGVVNHLATGATLPTFERVAYRDLWPGVDMVFKGGASRLKYEFHLRPGASPEAIRLAYAGAQSLSLTAGGALAVQTPGGTLKDAAPKTYQVVDGRRVPVESRYRLDGGTGYGFAVGSYDRSQPLVIDPALIWSTYLGGDEHDAGLGVAVDRDGNAFVTGDTNSSDFPTTPGAFDEDHNGNLDAFVTKLNRDGSALVYSTYLGGSDTDRGEAIEVDSKGTAFVHGTTDSEDFPTTGRAFDRSHNGGFDTFVTRLNGLGSGLLYSTYLGGSEEDGSGADGLVLDSQGNAHVTGRTGSANFPTTSRAFDRTHNGARDVYATKINASGTGLLFSTFIGGSSDETGHGIALDSRAAVTVVGDTASSNYPVTARTFDTTQNGDGDVFVTRLNATGTALQYSTFVGGSAFDGAASVAVNRAGNAFVTGVTYSSDFPTTPGAHDETHNGDADAFVFKLSPTGTSGPSTPALVYSTYLGGSGEDEGSGIALEADNATVVGSTDSGDFPTTPGAFQESNNGGFDAFLTRFDPAGQLFASTLLGGSEDDFGYSVAQDQLGIATVSGDTASSDFPTTPGAFDEDDNGGPDAWVARLNPKATPEQQQP